MPRVRQYADVAEEPYYVEVFSCPKCAYECPIEGVEEIK